MRTFSVQELSKRSGVTRRTLQYYDNIGLLTASRDQNGHRIYDDNHVKRLTQINFYKNLGISLQQIQDKLEGPDSTEETESMLEGHSRLLHRELESVQAKLHGIDVSKKLLSAGYTIPWDLLSYLMQALELDPVDHWRDYSFPKDDLAVLSELFPTQKELMDFYNEFRRIMIYAAAYQASHVPVASELAKELCEEWIAMVSTVTAGDPAITDAFLRVDNNRAKWSQGERDLMTEGEPYLMRILGTDS